MSRLSTALWAAAAIALVAGAALLWFIDGPTLALTFAAAFGAAVGAVAAGLGNRSSERMARDVRRLAELTETSIEEARAQRPDPSVLFVADESGSPTRSILIERKRLLRDFDVEAIVTAERERALATIPEPKPESHKSPWLAGTSEIARLAEQFSAAYAPTGPATNEERASFTEEVDGYVEELQQWLAEYAEWRRQTELMVVLPLRFENRGRVPARDLRVQLTFPDAFEPIERRPSVSEPPEAPTFRRRSPRTDFLGSYGRLTTPVSRLDLSHFQHGNVSPPRYRKGSVIVEIEIDKLLHRIPDDNADDPIKLLVERDGHDSVTWEIYAENVAEPTTGELMVRIETDAEEGPPIMSLGDLRPAREEEPRR